MIADLRLAALSTISPFTGRVSPAESKDDGGISSPEVSLIFAHPLQLQTITHNNSFHHRLYSPLVGPPPP